MKSPNATAATIPPRKLICCAVQGEEYCFDLSDVHSITRAHHITPYPQQEGGSPALAPLGWVATQQDKLPVYDLAQRLQLAPQPAPQAAHDGFVVALKTNQPYALRVDRITGNIDLPATQMAALPPIVEVGGDPLFKGIAQLNEKWLLCADVNRLQPQGSVSHTEASPAIMGISPTPRPGTSHVVALTSEKAHHAAPQVLIFLPATSLEPSEDAVPLVFGLSLKQLQEVTKLTNIISVPKAPSYVLGIINWRNLPVPIIDLAARLGLTATPAKPKLIDPQSRLLIARAPQQAGLMGILVKPQVKTFRLPIPYQALQQPLALAADLVKGVFELEGTPFVIPDLDAMLTRNFAPALS